MQIEKSESKLSANAHETAIMNPMRVTCIFNSEPPSAHHENGAEQAETQ